MNVKKFKMAVFDIDGVLNEHGSNVLSSSIEAINRLHEKGIRIAFASGKDMRYIHGGLVFSGLLKEDTVIIAENGGVVFYPSLRRLKYHSRYLDRVKRYRKEFYSRCSVSNGYTILGNDLIWEEPKSTSFTIYPLTAEVFPIGALSKVMGEVMGDDVDDIYLIENIDSVEVMQKGISKKQGMKVLCDWCRINKDDVIAFGDGMNDYDMLDSVGYPIAVGNARDEVKQLVNKRHGYVAEKRFGDGVLEAVDMLIRERMV